jgi:hypothetical protein
VEKEILNIKPKFGSSEFQYCRITAQEVAPSRSL